jgi:hypothetical protein
MKKATQRMLKQAIRIINSIDYPIQAKKRIVTTAIRFRTTVSLGSG